MYKINRYACPADIAMDEKREEFAMKEVRSPKKPLIYYYAITLLVIFLFNIFITPLLMQGQVEEVDYGVFMEMTEKKDIGSVQVEDSQIVFTDKGGTAVYKTGVMDDPSLAQRLYDAGAKFAKNIDDQHPSDSGVPHAYLCRYWAVYE